MLGYRFIYQSPNVIFDDANLADAIPGAIRAFVGNAGQICSAGTRLLVQKSIHDAVVAGLVQGLGQVKTGPEPDAMVGALTTQAQYERVKAFFDIAKADGAKAEIGGVAERRPEWERAGMCPPLCTPA